MEQVFCVNCGQKIAADVSFCPGCGANQAPTTGQFTAASSPTKVLPEGIKGWSWGAFWFTWIWAIFNKTWIGLLALIPVLNVIMMVVLGLKGREWAWKNKHWTSVDEFNRVQKKWNLAGWIAIIAGLLLGIAFGVFENYKSHAKDISISQQKTDKENNLNIKEEEPSLFIDSPPPIYTLPILKFSKIEFLGAMKSIHMETHWESEFINYLSKPQTFWSECVASNAAEWQMKGGMNQAEAQSYGTQSCQSTTQIYYQCLNGTPLEDAVMCLRKYINEVAENGD